MIPGVQPKFILDKNLNILTDQLVEMGLLEHNFNWKLIRKHDEKIVQSKEIVWIEWDEYSKFKNNWNIPKIGFSLLMSPFNEYYTWMTSEIVELIENKKKYVHFKTKNSEYELFKINNI